MSSIESPVDVIHLGVARAASTWLAASLKSHPGLHVSPAKDIYFFDREFHRGYGWYRRQLSPVQGKLSVDVSHDYFHSPNALARIAEDAPDVPLLLCLREPTDWISSILRNSVRNGATAKSFDQLVGDQLGVLSAGLFSYYLKQWFEAVGRSRMYVYLFDDVRLDGDRALAGIIGHLGLDPAQATAAPRQNAAVNPRSRFAARAVRGSAQLFRSAGAARAVGLVKSAAVVRRALYSDTAVDDVIDELSKSRLKDFFRHDVERTSELLGRDLVELWGY